MVERTANIEIMQSIQKYIEKISKYYKIEAIILFGSYAIRIQDYKNAETPFIQKIMDTGIKVA